ncbi:MAG: ATP-dependent DNA helicase RecQ [Candidatus Acidiferrales bacterium]
MDAQSPTAYSESMPAELNLHEPLRRYWGYDSFRPMQERIIRSLIAGKDTCVIMPTGGGKSLCYQLPAALSPKSTAIVVSPLIALMQDQTAQLAQMGIEAAVLNSFVAKKEASAIMDQAAQGRYRLLYLSPERIAQRPTMAWLQHVPVSFFVIDEAHCISEWGHEFRPEYRQLSSLRIHFPDRPIAAFTASATQHVRHDIIEQLKLRDPDKYIASFYRQNLNYIIRQCDAATQFSQLVDAIRAHPDGSIIVYSPTRDGVKETVDALKANGIDAIGYHGQMEASTRRRNQEAWMAGDVRVIVGTIAFGLGINKADVRAVIHLSLPKSIEQYYQEAGRGGRDGRPTDCLLLWQPRDAGLLGHFISQIKDAAEKERAWQRYNTIRDFVESNACRHRRICSHFGEKTKWETCGACDVCGYIPDWLISPMPPKPRKRTKSQRPPQSAPLPAPIPAPIHAYSPASMSASISAPMRASTAATFSPKVALPAPVAADLAELRAYLREWRRQTAQRQSIAAFIVMHDTTLDDLCEKRPTSLAELRQVFGFGVRKTELYGQEILAALKQFREGARAEPAQQKLQARAAGTLSG